jgi:hydroxypyruvate reductase
LVAGTDGSDGPTDAAGGIIDGNTWDASGQDALDKADAGTWLAHKGALLKTGPTGTNVMDLVIALKA